MHSDRPVVDAVVGEAVTVGGGVGDLANPTFRLKSFFACCPVESVV